MSHWEYASQVDRHVGEALEAMRELEKHISQKKENKAKVKHTLPTSPNTAERWAITQLQQHLLLTGNLPGLVIL